MAPKPIDIVPASARPEPRNWGGKRIASGQRAWGRRAHHLRLGRSGHARRLEALLHDGESRHERGVEDPRPLLGRSGHERRAKGVPLHGWGRNVRRGRDLLLRGRSRHERRAYRHPSNGVQAGGGPIAPAEGVLKL